MAEFGSTCRRPRFCCTQVQVPGITCITPRALAEDTMPLLNPDSCQAIALASEDGTPLRDATAAMAPEDTRDGVAVGAACGTRVTAGAGWAAPAGAGEPVGSLITVPLSRTPFGSRPFMAAIAEAGTPAVTAIAD